MTRFAVVRNREIGVGICPDSALDDHRTRGWFRVSDWVDDPNDLYPPQFADGEDLDAPPPPPPPVAEPAAETEADPAESKETSE